MSAGPSSNRGMCTDVVGQSKPFVPPLCRCTVAIVLVFGIGAVFPVSPTFAQAPGDDGTPTPHVAVFTPTTVGNTYWPEVHRVLRAAADHLELEISFHEYDIRDRFAKAEAGVEQLTATPAPDAAIFSVAFGQAQPLMGAAEAADIPFFLHGPLFPAELAEIGGTPRKTYRTWIGYFYEDEEEKGFRLARQLIAAARAHGHVSADGTVRAVGVGGDTTWYGSELRERGLRRAVNGDPEATLLQTVPTRWTPAEGQDVTARLMDRYTDVSVIWAASDQLALGVVDAIQARGEVPDETVFTGGLDLSLVGLEAVANGDLTATVAAAPLAWAQILAYLSDYLRGIDFADRLGTEIVIPPEAATRSSAAHYIDARDQYGEIDFRQYSRYYSGTDAQDLIGASER